MHVCTSVYCTYFLICTTFRLVINTKRNYYNNCVDSIMCILDVIKENYYLDD